MRRILHYLEVPVLIAVPLGLLVLAALGIEQSALVSALLAIAAVAVCFANYESEQAGLRQIMPTVVLAALAAAGRILFAPIVDFKPVSAICILAGAVFGKRSGFMVGALAAFVSNFFFGQGAWTPWQMYAWGMIGYLSGVFAQRGWLEHTPVVLVFGFLSGFFYGFLLNTWHIIGFVSPITWQSVLLTYAAGAPYDLVHCIATVFFLAIIYVPWKRKLERIKSKYAIGELAA